jgi:CheY-like chemotaxis protein
MTHVLVVDDEPHLLRTLTMNLSGRGYRVTPTVSGTRALELAATEYPDLIVLDLGLPDIDGLEVIRRLRERLDGRPIIVLSARSGTREKVAALDLGANDYVTKPPCCGAPASSPHRPSCSPRRGATPSTPSAATCGSTCSSCAASWRSTRAGRGI